MSEKVSQGVRFPHYDVPEDGTIYLERLTQHYQQLAGFDEDLASLTSGWVGSDEGDEFEEDQEGLTLRDNALSGGDRLIPNPNAPGTRTGETIMEGYYRTYSGHWIWVNKLGLLGDIELFSDECCRVTEYDGMVEQRQAGVILPSHNELSEGSNLSSPANH